LDFQFSIYAGVLVPALKHDVEEWMRAPGTQAAEVSPPEAE
jgi:hypothetical protein